MSDKKEEELPPVKTEEEGEPYVWPILVRCIICVEGYMKSTSNTSPFIRLEDAYPAKNHGHRFIYGEVEKYTEEVYLCKPHYQSLYPDMARRKVQANIAKEEEKKFRNDNIKPLKS